MIPALLRYASIAISAIVILSFAMFVTDQSNRSTRQEVATLGDETSSASAPQPAAAQQPATATPKKHGQPRKAIDDADKAILQPFHGFVANSKSEWARKGIPSMLALLVFGFGLSMLAAYLPKS
jgi:hypothetical protein